VAISSDGQYLAYTRAIGEQTGLWLRQFATGADVPLVQPGQYPIRDVVISPRSDYVYFSAGAAPVRSGVLAIYRIPIVGGTARKIIEGAASPITFSPDGRHLAFVRRTERGLPAILVAADVDGSREEVLYSGEDALYSPQWSPQENLIACQRLTENSPVTLSVIDLRQRKLNVLRPTSGIHYWMPDGNAFIAPKAFPEPTQQLRYIPYPRGKERRITSDLASYIGASITSDGRTIATVQLQSSKSIWSLPHGSKTGQRQITPTIDGRSDGGGISWAGDGTMVYASADREIRIVSISRPGAEQKVLLSEPIQSTVVSAAPAISPDGKWIAFSSHGDGAIWIIDRDGGNRRKLTTGNADLDPQWTPDGSTIIYSSNERLGGSNPSYRALGIWKIPAVGGNPTMIDPKGHSARLSPDGTHLVMTRAGVGNPVVTALDGSNARELPPRPGEGTIDSFQWSPDGTAIDYIGPDGELWRRPINGATARRVTNSGERIEEWAWTHDGTQLAVTRRTMSTDAVLIRDRGE